MNGASFRKPLKAWTDASGRRQRTVELNNGIGLLGLRRQRISRHACPTATVQRPQLRLQHWRESRLLGAQWWRHLFGAGAAIRRPVVRLAPAVGELERHWSFTTLSTDVYETALTNDHFIRIDVLLAGLGLRLRLHGGGLLDWVAFIGTARGSTYGRGLRITHGRCLARFCKSSALAMPSSPAVMVSNSDFVRVVVSSGSTFPVLLASESVTIGVAPGAWRAWALGPLAIMARSRFHVQGHANFIEPTEERIMRVKVSNLCIHETLQTHVVHETLQLQYSLGRQWTGLCLSVRIGASLLWTASERSLATGTM